MFIFPLLASSGEQRIVIGNGGQVSTNFHTVVSESHWSARCRRRGDAKMIHRHLLQTCTSGFHIPTVKSSLSPRQWSNISMRTSSGRISIVICPAVHRTSQHSFMRDTATQQTHVDLVRHWTLLPRGPGKSLPSRSFRKGQFEPKTWMHLEIGIWLGTTRRLDGRLAFGKDCTKLSLVSPAMGTMALPGHTRACEKSLALVRARRLRGPIAAEQRYLEPWDTYPHFGNWAPRVGVQNFRWSLQYVLVLVIFPDVLREFIARTGEVTANPCF